MPAALADEYAAAVSSWARSHGAKYRTAVWQPMGLVPRSAQVHTTLQKKWDGR